MNAVMPVMEACEIVCRPAPPSPVSWTQSRALKVCLAFAAVYLIWGSTFLGIRIAIETIPPMIMAGLRWSIAGSLFYSFLRWRGAPPPRGGDLRLGAIICGGIIFGGKGSGTFSEQYIPSGTGGLGLGLLPALTVWFGRGC